MRVVVVGGGLSGLFTASALIARGVEDLVVVDRAGEAGGVANTIERDGFCLEPAVGTLTLPHPDLSPILERSGVGLLRAEPSAASRYVYDGGRLIVVPSGPAALGTPLIPLHSRLRVVTEPLIRRERHSGDESLADFCRRRFGRNAGGLLAWLAASGVYAGDPDRLAVADAFPILTQLEEQAGSVIRGVLKRRRARPPGFERPSAFLPVGGMSEVARSIVGQLGERYRTGFEVGRVTREGPGWVVEGPETLSADHVVMACHPEQTALLLGGELSSVLLQTVAAPVTVVGLGGGSGPYPLPEGFGALIGSKSGLVSLGILFESSYAPHRAPTGSWLVKVIAGGACNPEIVAWDDEVLAERVSAEVSSVIGTDLSPEFVEVVRHHPGIPQYNVGHGAWLRSVDDHLAELPGLHVTGWGYRGVGVSHIASDAVATARRVSETV